MDPYLLIGGLVRILTLAVGAIYAFRYRRWWGACAFGLAAINAIPTSINYAHGKVQPDLLDVAAFMTTPIAALLVSAFLILHSDYQRERNKCAHCPLLVEVQKVADECSHCQH